MAALKGQVVAAQRPALDGVKGGSIDPQRAAFVERYLRRGLEAGVELKSFSGASGAEGGFAVPRRSEEHTSELQSLMRISYAVFCLKKKNHTTYNSIRLRNNSHTHKSKS